MKKKISLLVILMLVLGAIGFAAEKKFGSSTVGYITQPEGFNLAEYKPTPASMSITNGSEVILLDGAEGNAKSALQTSYDTFLNNGISKEALTVSSITFNNHPAQTLTVGLGNGETSILTFIEHGKKVYLVQIVGKTEEVGKLQASLEKTWSTK